MNLQRLQCGLKKNKVPVVVILQPGDEIQESDIVINKTFVESPSPRSVGTKVENDETIIRLTYNL
jgi:hypothetical protein